MADNISAQHEALQKQVQQVFNLISQELSLRYQDLSGAQESLRKVVSPTFELVFAGAFSAGKSMLINALLERKLLYSAEGHATGTECQIAYAEPGQERVVLTFLSRAEIAEQLYALAQRLGLTVDIDQVELLELIKQQCSEIIRAEGGESRSERAKQASALRYLVEGSQNNRDRILPHNNAVYPMEQFNFASLQEAATYARRGANSAVLKRIEYYCHDPLLKDGNILVDTPGIDAPVRKDAELTYNKIKNPDTSAVICILKAAETGELTTEETELLETIRANPSIRDRVFFVFNRVDKTWQNSQLRQRLEGIVTEQFQDSSRVYKTSGLLGFYASQLKSTSIQDRFGLDSLFVEEANRTQLPEETPLFVSEFNTYCSSGKLIGTVFRPEIRGYELPNENFVRILSEYGNSILDQLVKDSGVETFRNAITHYLTTEKRPQLLSNLADDLQPICIALRKHYIETWQHFEAQPRDVESMQQQSLQQVSQSLMQVSQGLQGHLERELNQVVASTSNRIFEEDFRKLQARLVSRLDELITKFSVAAVHQQAQASHKRNSVVPLLGVLAEAYYFLANGLEDVLAESSDAVMRNFFQHLISNVQEQDYYRELYRLLGNDCDIEHQLLQLQELVCHAIQNEARIECDRYVRENPAFYSEGSVSLWQLRQTLQQVCKGYDYQSMVEAEPAIRQLLKLDFEEKVRKTVMDTFRQVLNTTLNTHLLKKSQQLGAQIVQQYDAARIFLSATLAKEATEKIQEIKQHQAVLQVKIDEYNCAIQEINVWLESMHMSRKKLPELHESDLTGILIQSLDEESITPENEPESTIVVTANKENWLPPY
jgi:replication fork clamp-binding protein CrfC